MRKIIAAIDIGSTNYHAILARILDDLKIEVVGSLLYSSQGLKNGNINDSSEFSKSLDEFKDKLDNIIGYSDYPTIIGLNGVCFTSKKTKGVVALSENEVIKDDIRRAIEQASSFNITENRLTIEALPIDYAVDNERNIKNPLGLKGIKLEANILLVEAFAPYFKNMENILSSSKINIKKIIFTPITSLYSAVSKKQKELGCVVVDIGGMTTTIVVIEDGAIVHIKVLPIGSHHITSDIVYGFKINFPFAEEIKIKYGSLIKKKKEDKIDLSKLDPQSNEKIERVKLIEIIEARVKEIFENVNLELKKINKQRMLPGGAILIGGGAKLKGISEVARNILELPTQVGYPLGISGLIEEVNSPLFTNCVGLLHYHLLQEEETVHFNYHKIMDKIKNLFRNLIP